MSKSLLKIIDNKNDFYRLIEHCKKTGYCSHDYETTSAEFYNPDNVPLILGVSFQMGSAWILPMGHFESPFKKSYKKLFKEFSNEVFMDPNITKIAYNAKFEYKWTIRGGGDYRGRLFDAMLAKYLLDEERPHDLKSLVSELIPDFAGYELNVKGRKWDQIPIQELSTYCGLDCDLTLRLMVYLEGKLIKHGFYNLFRNLMSPATYIIAHMEYHGAYIDRGYLDALIESYTQRIEENEKNVKSLKPVARYNKAKEEEHLSKLLHSIQAEIEQIEAEGKPNKDRLIAFRQAKLNRYLEGNFTARESYGGVNFNSPNQMIELLHTHPAGFKFDVIKYTKDKTTKRNTQRPSTDEEALLELRKIDKSGFIDRLLKHRELQKLFSTYMIGIRDKLSIRNKIHTSFLLHGTVTGRLSSREPNLQNIPRSTTTSDIKKMFVCPKGFVLLEVDYSQAELRVVAELAEEETMLNWFREGQNIHTAVAAQLAGWGDRISEVKAILKNPEHPDNLFWEKQKKKAKIVNFGILYGQTAENLAGSMSSETERVTSEEAQEFLDKWLDTFPRIRKYMKNTHKFVKEHGYVKSLFGRKRRLPGVYSELRGEVNKALRDSVNAPIQGTASDFTLFSSIIIHEERLKGTLPASMRQVYTVHDSLGFYIKPEHIHEAVPKIIEICNNPKTQQYFDFELTKVKMKVSPEVGANWGSLEEYSPTMDYKTLLTNDK